MSSEHEKKIETHLQNAVDAEEAGDIEKAEKEWRYAVFYDARLSGVDVKEHIAECCPVY